MLKFFYFTLYYLDEDVEFANTDNFHKKPTTTMDLIHSQFQLDLNEYRDNNNFIKINNIETKDQRYNIFTDPKYFKFFTMEKGPYWVTTT